MPEHHQQSPVLSTSVPSTLSISTSTTTPFLHLRRDPYCGRKYHASTALPAEADLLGAVVPYSYTVWKRFRNEVCAECWRYERGRRSHLTRRDGEGFGAGRSETRPLPLNGKANAAAAVGAGLWFCDGQCQQRWIEREGLEAVGLLRRLEAARQKKPPKAHAGAQQEEQTATITQEVVDQAWDAVRAKERSPKEVQRWRSLQLDDYEADMARYVLLALLRCRREAHSARNRQATDADPPQANGAPREGDGQGSGWATFASLQANELSLLRPCPEILGHQTRIYRVLKGCFGLGSTKGTHPSRSKPHASPDSTQSAEAADEGPQTSGGGASGTLEELGDVITIDNVRTILGVDPGNSFGVWEVPLMEESECLGFAVYPTASFFNHRECTGPSCFTCAWCRVSAGPDVVSIDCSPNVRKEREGRTLRFVTTEDVEDEEELCISYGHVEGMSVDERRKELAEGWYFECRCSRCVAEAPS